MASTEHVLRARARRGYELGRLRTTVRDTWIIAPIVAIGGLHSSNLPLVLVAGILLFAIVTLLSWRGQSWASAVWPGYLAGAVPLLMPSLASAKAVCWIGGSCFSLCVLLCPLSGLVAGLGVGVLTTRQAEDRLPFLGAATLVAGLTGAIGCALAGLLGIGGMIAGGLLGLAPFYVTEEVRRGF